MPRPQNSLVNRYLLTLVNVSMNLNGEQQVSNNVKKIQIIKSCKMKSEIPLHEIR